mgnify:CR=1 FL=1
MVEDLVERANNLNPDDFPAPNPSYNFERIREAERHMWADLEDEDGDQDDDGHYGSPRVRAHAGVPHGKDLDWRHAVRLLCRGHQGCNGRWDASAAGARDAGRGAGGARRLPICQLLRVRERHDAERAHRARHLREHRGRAQGGRVAQDEHGAAAGGTLPVRRARARRPRQRDRGDGFAREPPRGNQRVTSPSTSISTTEPP